MKEYSSGNEFPFTFIIDDPSGKSHVKNPFAPKIDPMLRIEIYERTREQLQHMGFDVENSVLNQSEINKKAEQPTENAENKVLNHNNTNNKVQPPIENNLKSNGENKEVEKEKNDSLKTDKKEESSLNTEKNREQLVQEGAHRLDFTKPLVEDLKQESFEFTTDCHVCMGQSETRMCVIAIPYFKELIIMSSSCKNCGASSADTKTGGYIKNKYF